MRRNAFVSKPIGPSVEHGVGLVVILVHGTWGRGILFPQARVLRPRWFDEGSKFRNLLESVLASKFQLRKVEGLFWSGENSIKAREGAAILLSARLQELKKEYPKTEQVVIAHSHGGNIALRCIEHLPKEYPVPHLVTVATPFVSVEPSSRPLWQEIITLICLGVSTALLMRLTSGWLQPLHSLKMFMFSMENGHPNWWIRLAFLVPAGVVLYPIYFLLPSFLSN